MKTNWNTPKTKNQPSAYVRLVEKIYQENNKPTYYKGTIASMLYEFFSKTSKYRYTWKRETFKSLLIHIYNQKGYGILRNYNTVAVLHNMSGFGDKLIRAVDTWENKFITPEEQLSSLIKHCFVVYKTPTFLENSFYGFNKKDMLWYIQLGKGKSIKELSKIPISLTSKMAHEFRNAPAFMTGNEALRYVQALGFGATVETAKVIGLSKLSFIKKEEEVFWSTVIRFFANEKNLKPESLEKMIDYLTVKYAENKKLSMKSRTLKALKRQAEEWYKSQFVNKNGPYLEWKASGVKPLYVEEFTNTQKVIYRTVELLNSVALFNEGNEMSHCVAEYDKDCKEGSSAIFSLQKLVEGKPIERLATLEVGFPEYQIKEAKAVFNDEPDEKAIELMNKWIVNSELKRQVQMAYERPYGQEIGMRVEDKEMDMIMVVKVMLFILYIIIKFM